MCLHQKRNKETSQSARMENVTMKQVKARASKRNNETTQRARIKIVIMKKVEVGASKT